MRLGETSQKTNAYLSMVPSDSKKRSLLFLIFFVSGFTGLIYESLWSHYLKLFLGHAAYAQSLVLMIFMGGMALGAAIASKLSRRLKNLLVGYAAAEIGIGLMALAFHPVYSALMDLSFDRLMPGMGSPSAIEVYKWAVAGLLLLPPSVLLGTTFPLMSGAVLRRFPGMNGGNLATLYFSNSIGAALGVLVASFVLIEQLGLPGTLTLAGLINLLLGLWVLRLGRTPEAAVSDSAASGGSRDGTLLSLLLIAAFVTGAASFIYEVSWIRMLSLVLGSSSHAFELMLSAFITGLALGSLAIRRYIDRVGDPLAFAAAVQLAMGVLAVITLPVYGQSFEWMGELVRTVGKDDQGYLLFNLASHGIAFAVMLPATFMAGMTLPLFTHVLIRQGHGERVIGLVYASNTLGAIAGVIFTVHFALPSVGLKLSLAAGALFDIGLGLLLLLRVGATPLRWGMALACLCAPVLAIRFVALDGALLGSGVYRTGHSKLENSETLFYQDGKTASIHVSRLHPSTVAIRTNGKPDAAIEMDPRRPAQADEITMVMLGAAPLALRPDAQTVANIGFGSGLTSHVLLASPRLRELSTIEIEEAVIEGSKAFLPRVQRAYSDPRSRVYIEDAKSWFARHNRRFDIIISEPSNPWVSGVASLFSDEFYFRIRDYLKDDGLLVQWLQLYEFDTYLAASVMRALDRHFGDYAVYLADDANILIVAAKDGKVPSLSPEVFKLGGMGGELARVGIRTPDDFAVRRLGTAAMLRPMLQALNVPYNSDYHPYVDLNAPKARFLKRVAREFPMLGLHPLPLVEMLDPGASAWEAKNLTPTRFISRYESVQSARQISAALLSGVLPENSAQAEKVRGWKQALQSCGAAQDAAMALHEIAVTTLAHLDAGSATRLWQQPAWFSCGTPALQTRLRLYQAVARRDAQAMLQAAEAVLASQDDDVQWGRYALQAGLLAARKLTDDAAATRLWERHGPRLHADGQLSPELVLLLNYGRELKSAATR